MNFFSRGRKTSHDNTTCTAVASQADIELAATIAIGAMSIGISTKEEIVDQISRALPASRLEDRYFAVRVAAQCLSGQGLPQMYDYAPEVDPIPPLQDLEALKAYNRLQTVRADLQGARAKADLLLYGILRTRLLKGKYFDEVESLMSPLAASEVIWRFAGALQSHSDRLKPYFSDKEIGVPKAALLPAMKISYLHRHDERTWRNHLSNTVNLISHVVESELYDQILAEVGDEHPLMTPAYGALNERALDEMSSLINDWAAYCQRIDRRLAGFTSE